jgi:hypothetical protein
MFIIKSTIMYNRNIIKKLLNSSLVLLAILTLTSSGHHKSRHPDESDLQSGNEFSENKDAFKPVAYIIQLSSDNATLAADYDQIARKNIYGIAWEGTASDNLKYAKHMGYSHIMYQAGMEELDEARDIFFMLEKPENLLYPYLGISLVIQYDKTYTAAQQQAYLNYICLKNTTEPFPDNIANGWFVFHGNGMPRHFATVPDWQQKRVVDLTIQQIFAKLAEVERPARGFLFGGLAWDQGELTGDFSSDSVAFTKGRNVPVTLETWTGSNSSCLYPGASHEYATHSDGKAAYYKDLKTKLRNLYPHRNLIFLWEPYRMAEDLQQVLERPDRELLLDNLMLVSEAEGTKLTQFADDTILFSSGLIRRDWVGSTVPNVHDFDEILEIVGKAGIQGSWFGWFGRFNKMGEGKDNIYEIPNWEQLARVIPSWDNLCGVPLSERSFKDGMYISSNSCMSHKVLYSRQHKTNKLFIVFMDPHGTVPLNAGDKILSVHRVDDFFIETTEAWSELSITSDNISMDIRLP